MRAPPYGFTFTALLLLDRSLADHAADGTRTSCVQQPNGTAILHKHIKSPALIWKLCLCLEDSLGTKHGS